MLQTRTPDEGVDVKGVELDVPNRRGPGGRAGMEKEFPGPEPEEDVSSLGMSHMAHFSIGDTGFIRLQAPQLHPFVFVIGGFNPTTPQLNPPESKLVEVIVVVVVVVAVIIGVLPEPKTRVEGGFGMENNEVVERFSAPGFCALHTVHFSLADTGLGEQWYWSWDWPCGK
jgi:hypothetical protein